MASLAGRVYWAGVPMRRPLYGPRGTAGWPCWQKPPAMVAWASLLHVCRYVGEALLLRWKVLALPHSFRLKTCHHGVEKLLPGGRELPAKGQNLLRPKTLY